MAHEKNPWLFNGRELTDADIPSDAVGFIYIIRQLSTGKRYIGRKLLKRSVTRRVKGRRKKVKQDSDWRDYWSSSPKIKEWIAAAGSTDDFTREILVFCKSRGSLTYAEELALYLVGALETDDWINDNIRSKIYRSWVKPEDAAALRLALTKV